MPTMPTTPPTTFTGSLSIENDADGRPLLLVTHRCPACRGYHTHTWTGTLDDAPTHRNAHCWRESSPFRHPHGSGYHVGPDDTLANRTTHARFVQLLAEHEHRVRPAARRAAAACDAGGARAG